MITLELDEREFIILSGLATMGARILDGRPQDPMVQGALKFVWDSDKDARIGLTQKMIDAHAIEEVTR